VARPWLRLDAYFTSDGKLIKAGPDARLAWPHVLCALKVEGGVASSEDLDPTVLAHRVGGAPDMWARAVARLVDVGLLVPGLYEIADRRATKQVRGFACPGWSAYQPDDRARGPALIPEDEEQTVAVGSERTVPMTGRDGTGRDVTRRDESNSNDGLAPGGATHGTNEVDEAGGGGPGPVGAHDEAGDAKTRTKPKRPTKAQERWRDAEDVVAHWDTVCAGTGTPRSKGNSEWRKELARSIADHLKRHPIQDVLMLVDHLGQETWWREQKDRGGDIFKTEPMKWARHHRAESKAKFTERIEQARTWDAGGRVREQENGRTIQDEPERRPFVVPDEYARGLAGGGLWTRLIRAWPEDAQREYVERCSAGEVLTTVFGEMIERYPEERPRA
jgi:hypothetical protein